MLDLFIKIGFLTITIWDIIDILVVGFLIYQIFKLLRGSMAFNIVIGLFLLFFLSELVEFLNMDLLSKILGQFVNLGVLALLIVFQPEARRFLVMLGKTTLNRRFKFWQKYVDTSKQLTANQEKQIAMIVKTAESFSGSKTGALMVFSTDPNLLEGFTSSGTRLDASISQSILESIFHKESPLHDGAVIFSDSKIHTAACVLPLSDSNQLPKRAGLRHRAGLGVTERTNAISVIVSEESGKISMAQEGELKIGISLEELRKGLMPIFKDFYDDTGS